MTAAPMFGCWGIRFVEAAQLSLFLTELDLFRVVPSSTPHLGWNMANWSVSYQLVLLSFVFT